MKAWIFVLMAIATTGSLTVQARNSNEKEITHFTCGGMGHGDAFSVQIGGPRFGDQISLRYLEQEIKQLLRANEASLETSDENINLVLSMGNCSRGAGDVLVSCGLSAGDWAIMDYGFTKAEQLAGGFYEVSRITRGAHVAALDLKVVQKGTDAHLDLRMTVSTAERENQEFVIQKKLATLNQDWYMCRFVSN